MHQGEFAIAGGRCLAQLHLGQFSQHTVTQQPVFAHGKTVAGRQWQNEIVGVESLHGVGDAEEMGGEPQQPL